MSKYTGLEIAVIGLSGRFPGAKNIGEFWKNLRNGVDSIAVLTSDEILKEGEDEKIVNNPSYVKANAFVEGKEFFDSSFFDYRPDEAELMDPQLRIYHECCWEALEDSGYGLDDTNNRTGIFSAGSVNIPWALHAESKNRDGLVNSFTASHLRDSTFLSTRISYKFNLKGPAVFIQSACSSSLVAIHEACNSLLLGECELALAGGVNIKNHSKKGYIYEKGMIRSKDGKCRPFDSESTGTVGGEGAGVVVLKKLSKALNDNDNIYAIIKGAAINNDGSNKVGFTAPSVAGQATAITKALKMARVDPSSITYVEAHGTATELGDPIEIQALNKVFGKSKKKTCAVGSVKSNIGHLDTASGVAGFIKTVLAIKHKQLPPTLHFKKPNPNINFDDGPLYVNANLKDWKNSENPLRAGVSSFGIGGTNAHIVLEESPISTQSGKKKPFNLLLLSAKTTSSLENYTTSFIDFLKENREINLTDVAYTQQIGRERFSHRKMLVCQTSEEGIKMLKTKEGIFEATKKPHEELRNIVFMFSGQGSQYINMGKDLYEGDDFFKETVDECLQIACKFSDKNLKVVLYPETGDKQPTQLDIHSTDNTQPLLFIFEYALAKLVMRYGIKPNFLIGHSIGEYTAACISGVLSLEDALRLVLKRGELMKNADPGAMLSIAISEEEIRKIITEKDRVEISVINGNSSLVVSGGENEILNFQKKLSDKGYESKNIRTSHAFHSSMMEPILGTFEDQFDTIEINAPKTPYISNATGEFITERQVKDPSYWSNHLRNTVRFHQGIQTLSKQGDLCFLEIGPGRVLSNLVNEFDEGNNHSITINTVRQFKQENDDHKYFIEKMGQMWLQGIDIDWAAYYEEEIQNRVSLPTYSFDKLPYTTLFNLGKILNGRPQKENLKGLGGR